MMRGMVWILLAALLMLPAPYAPVASAASVAQPTPDCPVSGRPWTRDLVLPLTRANLARAGRLSILAIGGNATEGVAAGDPSFTYPARLRTELAEAFPDKNVSVQIRAGTATSNATILRELPTLIHDSGANLVIWASGTREAASSADIDDYVTRLAKGIDAIHAAGADVILLDMQFAPSIARIVNTAPYREALHGTAAAHDVSVLRRYDLMVQWSDKGIMNLDAKDGTERQLVARQLFGCIATTLSSAITAALQ